MSMPADARNWTRNAKPASRTSCEVNGPMSISRSCLAIQARRASADVKPERLSATFAAQRRAISRFLVLRVAAAAALAPAAPEAAAPVRNNVEQLGRLLKRPSMDSLPCCRDFSRQQGFLIFIVA